MLRLHLEGTDDLVATLASLAARGEADFSRVEPVVREILAAVRAEGDAAVHRYTEKFDRRVNPRGRTYFWASPEFLCPDPHPGTDVEALADSYITVTPLQFDLTDHAKVEPMRQWEWKVE